MPTTTFTFGDFTNIVAISGPTFVNAVDIAAAPLNPNFGGSYSEPAYHVDGDNTYSDSASASGVWGADIDFAGAISQIPTNARITKVTVRMRLSGALTTSDITATFANEVPPNSDGIATAGIRVQFIVQAPSSTVFWRTAFSFVNTLTDVVDGPTPPVSASNSSSPTLQFYYSEYDFTTNPHGDFPDGYIDYLDFIANFTQVRFTQTILSDVESRFDFGGQPPTATIDGLSAGGISLQATDPEMIVEWYMAPNWAITSDDPLVLPDNIIKITRPDPEVPVEEDDEIVKSVIVGEKEIFPDDPWVILWTRFEIILHCPADEVDDPISISITLFDGVVPLGSIDVTTADLSGIYQLDINATNDTLYTRSGTTTSTTEAAIPSPFFVTYFVDNKETDVMHYTGSRMRIKGTGLAHQQFHSLDSINTESFGDLTLFQMTNLSPFALANFIDQQCALRVYTTAIDEIMNVSQIAIFFKKLYTGYPQ